MQHTAYKPQYRKTRRRPRIDDNPDFEYKRLILAGIVTVLWVLLGVLGLLFQTHFFDLSVYFLSLTGFVGAYIISETKRPSISTSVFKKGRSSKREITVYVMVALWLALGIICIVQALDLLEAAAYFSALTPYISTYLIGSAYKPDLPKSTREQMMGMGGYGGYGGYYGGYDPMQPGMPEQNGVGGQNQQVVSKPTNPIDP